MTYTHICVGMLKPGKGKITQMTINKVYAHLHLKVHAIQLIQQFILLIFNQNFEIMQCIVINT